MHEMSLVTSLLSIIREEMERHPLHRLLQVRARYGALANIVPEALSVAFERSYGRDGLGRGCVASRRNPPLAQVFSMRTNLFSRSAETFFGTVPFLFIREEFRNFLPLYYSDKGVISWKYQLFATFLKPTKNCRHV